MKASRHPDATQAYRSMSRPQIIITDNHSQVQHNNSEEAAYKLTDPPLAPQEEEKNGETKTPSEEDKQ